VESRPPNPCKWEPTHHPATMTAPDRAPISLRRIELAAGLTLMTTGMLVLLYAGVAIVNSRCTSPPPGPSFSGCWSGPNGYFVALGVIVLGMGVLLSVLGGFRRDRATRSS
jgi:hypothetical protein